jgi:hypothetical protein
MKMRSRLLVAVLMSALAACGGDDDDDDEGGNGGNDNTADHRSNMTGGYDLTGTIELVINGQTNSTPMQDKLDIKNDTGSNSKTALRLTVASVGCGPRATMNGERSFTVVATSCPMPPPQEGCTGSMDFDQGSASKPSGGSLQGTLKGKMVVKCGPASASGDFTITMTGKPTGQSLPGTREDALTGGISTGLSAALDQVTAAALQ